MTVGALMALVVGGAAFAQAQNAAVATKIPTHQSVGEAASPGDTDSAQAGAQSGSDQAGEQSGPGQVGETDARDSASEQNEAPESASENDGPDGPNDQADGADTGSEAQGD